MKIIFDTEHLGGLTLPQTFLLACINLNDSFNVFTCDFLENCLKAIQDNNLVNEYNKITTEGRTLLNEIVTGNTPEINIDELTEKLRQIYPLGKKPGTDFHWRSNPGEIKNKLRRFFKLFSEAKITEEEIIAATEKYVRDMEYDPYMRVLKYFILKMDVEHDQNSDLYTYICAAREGDNNISYDNQLI
jgi:hypothetical protein